MNAYIVEHSGSILLILWLLYVIVGFSSQIRKNYLENRFGRSFPLFLLALMTYIFGTIYGYTIYDKNILFPYALGLVYLLILLGQYLYYTVYTGKK